MERMTTRSIVKTTNELTQDLSHKKSISHYSTPNFKTLTNEQLNTLRVLTHVL